MKISLRWKSFFAEIARLLSWPLVLSVIYLIEVGNPIFQGVSIVLAVVATFSLANLFRGGAWEFLSRRELRNLIIISLGAVKLLLFANNQNQLVNVPGPIIWIVVGLLLFICLYLAVRDFLNSEVDVLSYMFSDLGEKYDSVRKVIFLFLSTLLCLEAYVHFGTQYVWIIAMETLSIFWLTGGLNAIKDKWSLPGTGEIIVIIAVLPVLAAPISTLYQFWSAVWRPLVLVMCLAIICLGAYHWRSKRAEKIRLKKHEQEKNERKKREAALEGEREKEKRMLELKKAEQQRNREEEIQKILDRGVASWDDVLKLIGLGLSTEKFPEQARYKIAELRLADVVIISHIKERFVWPGSDLKLILLTIMEFFQHSFDDNYLKKVIKQVTDFRNNLLEFKEYGGRKALSYMLRENCGEILSFSNLIEEEEEERK